MGEGGIGTGETIRGPASDDKRHANGRDCLQYNGAAAGVFREPPRDAP